MNKLLYGMNRLKKSKLDFSLIQKRKPEPKKIVSIKKETIAQSDLRLLRKFPVIKPKTRLPESLVEKRAKVSLVFSLRPAVSFALACILIVGSVQALSVVSSAKTTQQKILGLS